MFKFNGQSFSGAGNISIINNEVIIDGKKIDLEKALTIHIEGDIQSIKADYCREIEARGAVSGSAHTMSGNITCGDIGGSAQTMSGDIRAKEIKGNASSMSGDVST